MWGAVAPAIAYGENPQEYGVHVHARREVGGPKVVDSTFTLVRVGGTDGAQVEIDAESAVAFMVSAIAGQEPVNLRCSHCAWSHLDRDIFAARAHRKHLCNKCGREFWATGLTVANPVVAVRELFGYASPPPPRPATELLDIKVQECSRLAIWGSNPAILWTFPKSELAGIHVHAWHRDGELMADETYAGVRLNGEVLDVELIRLLMVQRLLFETDGRLVAVSCPACGDLYADRGPRAFLPTHMKNCPCGWTFCTPHGRNVVSNPMLRMAQILNGDKQWTS